MENTPKRLHIVSYGDSEQYRFYSLATEEPCEAEAPLRAYLQRFKDYVAKQCAGFDITPIAEPHVQPIAPPDEEMYAAYPLLDEKALHQIEKTLVTEAEQAISLRTLNDNAPFAVV